MQNVLVTSHRVAKTLIPLLMAACDAQPPAPAAAPQAVPVVVAVAEMRSHSETLEAVGSARAAESVQVTSRVSGRVRAIHFEEGSAVVAGAPLVTLESEEERAGLMAAQASAEQSASRLRRMQELAEKGLIPRDQLEQQANEAKNAEARRNLAEVQLAQRTIRAPFDGVLGFREVSLGALVTPGVGIVSLDKIDSIRVEFSVPESQLTQIAVGNSVEAQSAAYGERRFTGTVENLSSRVDPATRAIGVQARIDNGEGLLKPGMLLGLIVRGPARKALFVPEAALIPENDHQFVWRLTADDAAQKVQVQIGAREPGWVEIVAGLQAGERVVAEGGMNLRPGLPIRPVEAPKKN